MRERERESDRYGSPCIHRQFFAVVCCPLLYSTPEVKPLSWNTARLLSSSHTHTVAIIDDTPAHNKQSLFHSFVRSFFHLTFIYVCIYFYVCRYISAICMHARTYVCKAVFNLFWCSTLSFFFSHSFYDFFFTRFSLAMVVVMLLFLLFSLSLFLSVFHVFLSMPLLFIRSFVRFVSFRLYCSVSFVYLISVSFVRCVSVCVCVSLLCVLFSRLYYELQLNTESTGAESKCEE